MARTGLSRRVLVGLGAALAIAAGVVYTTTSSSVGANVTVVTNSTGTSDFAGITPLAFSYQHTPGVADDHPCVSLYEVDLASNVATTDAVRLSVGWTDTYDASKVLNNPHAFVGVQIYYPTTQPAATCTITVNSASVYLTGDTGASASATLSAAQANAVLQPSVTGQSTLYVLGGIHVPGGYPPGQQGGTGSLQFWLTALQ